jgi:DNA-binding IclR family transcriptional regulator
MAGNPVRSDLLATVGSEGGRQEHKALRRLLRLLEFVGHGGTTRPSELARQLGTSRSTVYWLIGLLTQEGYLERRSIGKGYRLGPAISLLAETRAHVDRQADLLPVLHRLAQRVSRPAHLAALVDGELAIVAVSAPEFASPVGVTAGFRGATHALAVGKVLVAAEGVRSIARFLSSRSLEPFTGNTITSPAELALQLKDVARRGFGTDVEEFATNLCTVAVPVVDESRTVDCAIGLATTRRRFADDSGLLLEALRNAAKLSARLRAM